MSFTPETGDPDDSMTLILLAGRPDVRLRAVTLYPGTRGQVGVARRILSLVGREDVEVGASALERPKDCVSSFHSKAFGPIEPADPDGPADELLARTFVRYPDATLVTGGPLGNVHALLTRHAGARIARVVAQGGFAGDDCVPPELRLPKFTGRSTCPTYNFNGHLPGARLLLGSEAVGIRYLVSKNVCHGIVYDRTLHERVGEAAPRSRSLALLHESMAKYLGNKPDGKIFHDPFAACCAIDPSIGQFVEVQCYRQSGGWGSRPKAGTGTWIIVSADLDRFHEVLLRTGAP